MGGALAGRRCDGTTGGNRSPSKREKRRRPEWTDRGDGVEVEAREAAT